MSMLRKPALMLAITISLVLLMYLGLVANRAFALIATGDPAGVWLGWGLVLMPLFGVWYLIHEWRLGTTVQRMSNRLEDEGRLPIHDGDTMPSGRLTDESAEAVFETARRLVDERPNDWAAWFHVAYAYEAARDRKMARRSLRYAADLFRKEQRNTG